MRRWAVLAAGIVVALTGCGADAGLKTLDGSKWSSTSAHGEQHNLWGLNAGVCTTVGAIDVTGVEFVRSAGVTIVDFAVVNGRADAGERVGVVLGSLDDHPDLIPAPTNRTVTAECDDDTTGSYLVLEIALTEPGVAGAGSGVRIATERGTLDATPGFGLCVADEQCDEADFPDGILE